MKNILFAIFLSLTFVACQDGKKSSAGGSTMVVMKTNMGEVEIELYGDKAPASVKNFLAYVDKKFYDGTVFHRVINGFMIQGGGYTADMKKKDTLPPIKNEADNGLKNDNGTLAMARTSVIDSATSQFFINVKNNDFLNHKDKSMRGYGYAVFGKVTKGMDVVNKIKAVNTASKGIMANVPVQPVVIESIVRK